MNSRRSFFKQLAVSAAAFSILPAAETYSRIWKPKAIVPVRYEINPAWVNAEYELFTSELKVGETTWKCYINRSACYQHPLGSGIRFTLQDGEYKQIHPYIAV